MAVRFRRSSDQITSFRPASTGPYRPESSGRSKPAWLSRRLSPNILFPTLFRILVLSFGVAGMYYWSPDTMHLPDDGYIIYVVMFLAFAFVLLPFIWPPHHSRKKLLAMIGVEFVLSAALLSTTGAINSPFLLYSLAPVLTAALFLPRLHTGIIAVMLVMMVIASIFIFTTSSGHSLSISFSKIALYTVTVLLMASLPYLINLNLKYKMEQEQASQERLKLSRELHDGIAQTLHALCWQVQILQHRQATGVVQQKPDLDKLENLAEKARRDILESLALLRNVNENQEISSLNTLLQKSLENVKQEHNINYTFKSPAENYAINTHITLEVSRIFQEALVNITNHAQAHHITVEMSRTNNHLELDIVDDGRGFDADAGNHNPAGQGHYGLQIMKERARAIRGDIRIISQSGQGTRVKIIFPRDL
jgi:signal transduction histidine kinase